MGKRKTKKKRTRVVKESQVLDEPSTSSSSHAFAPSAPAEESRVPPLLESRVPPLPESRVPPLPASHSFSASASDFDVMSNRKKKQLAKLHKQSDKEGPGHMKVRMPTATPLTTSRVPPVENVPDILSRLFEDSSMGAAADRLFAKRNLRITNDSLMSALVTSTNLTRTLLQAPITPGNLRRQREHALTDAGCSSAAECSDLDLPVESPVPSLVFTPTSEKGESEYGSCEQSFETVESSEGDFEIASPGDSDKDDDEMTSAESRKIAGKFDNKKTDAGLEPDDEEVETLAQLFGSIRMEDREVVPESPPQVSSHLSEISDSTADSRNSGENSAVSVSTEPHLTHEDQIVPEAMENLEAITESCEEMENIGELVSDMVEKCIAQVDELDENGIPLGSTLSANIVPIFDSLNSAIADLKAVLQTYESGAGAVRMEKSDDGPPKQSEDSPEGVATDEGSEKKDVGDLIPVAENKEIVPDEKEKAVLKNEKLINYEDVHFQLVGAGGHKAGKNASPKLDSNTNSRPHWCSAKLYCLEAHRLRSHLASCWKALCKEKHCWQITQVISHWIHCVEKNCADCPARGKKESKKVGEKVDRRSRPQDPDDHTMEPPSIEQRAMILELNEFLTRDGQHIILGYYIEYFCEVFVAYNQLRKEAGMRTLDHNDGEVPEKFLETVRHSCNCLPLNDCRDNQCHRLRIVIAHWSKWNGLCTSIECRLCDRICKRLRQDETEISELVEFISGKVKIGKKGTLQNELIQMVVKPVKKRECKHEIQINRTWKDSCRLDLKNACVNTCIFADAGYGEADGNEFENFDFASVFSKHTTYQLLVLTRYLLYQAISLREEQFYDTSSRLAIYYKNSMDEAVKLIRAVHTFVKEELSLFDDTWENGSEIMSSYKITWDKKYLLQMSSKMSNKMMDFADAIGT